MSKLADIIGLIGYTSHLLVLHLVQNLHVDMTTMIELIGDMYDQFLHCY